MKQIFDKISCLFTKHTTAQSSCPYTRLTYTVCYKCGKILDAK
jgi:hypothetical protein